MNMEKLIQNISSYVTPAIVYDLESIANTVKAIENDSKDIDNIGFLFSVKANRFSGVLNKIKDMNWGVDVASISEFNIVKEIGFSDIYATSPSFKVEELDYMYENGVIPDFNSISQIDLWCKNKSKKDYKNIGIRIKVEIPKELKHNTIYDENGRFGIDVRDELLMKVIEENNIVVKQLHFHLGEIRNSNVIKATIKNLKDIINSFPYLERINFGGGLTYLYSNVEERKNFWTCIKEFSNYIKITNKNIKFIFEPGMLITIGSGILVTSVLYLDKFNDDKYNAIVDASCWNLFSWSPIKVLKQIPERQGTKNKYMISGSSCYEADIFVGKGEFNRIEVGDRICFAYGGAYVSSMMRNMHGINYINEYIL